MIVQLITGDRHEVGTEEQRAEEEHGVQRKHGGAIPWEFRLFCARVVDIVHGK